MTDASLRRRLAEVIERGAPAQQAEAQRLATILDARCDDADALAAAAQLVDAYAHDPYLDRG